MFFLFSRPSRHCTTYVCDFYSPPHGFQDVFRQRDKIKRANRSRTESKDYCALTTTAAATAADSSRHRGYKAGTAAET